MEFLALLLTVFFAALCRAWQTQRLRWFVVAGVAAGLSFYTYLPNRLLPLALFPVFLLFALNYRSELRARRVGILLLVSAAIVVIAPLSAYFIAHPAAFFQRAGQVSILDNPGGLLDNAVVVAKMFFFAGDTNPRNNIPGRPALDWLLAGPFLIGLLAVLWRPLRPVPLLLLSWLVVMLLPTVLSEDAPSFQRAIGALPVVAVLVAVGLDRLTQWIGGGRPAVSRVVAALGSVLLLASIALTWQAFVSWSLSPELFYAWDVGFVRLAAGLKAAPAGAVTYLSPRGKDHPTVRYLAGDSVDLRGFDGAICVRLPERGAARYVFLTREDGRGPALISELLPDAASQTLVTGPDGQPWAVEAVQPADGRVVLQGMQPAGITFEDGMELLGYWVSDPAFSPGARVYVRLFWRASAPASRDYTTFLHLMTPAAVSSGQPLAAADAQPGGGSCNTSGWRPGEIIVDELQFVAPEAAQPGPYTLEVGMYDLATGARVRARTGRATSRSLRPPSQAPGNRHSWRPVSRLLACLARGYSVWRGLRARARRSVAPRMAAAKTPAPPHNSAPPSPRTSLDRTPSPPA